MGAKNKRMNIIIVELFSGLWPMTPIFVPMTSALRKHTRQGQRWLSTKKDKWLD